jgi:DNA-binding NtrC family response regulator
MFFKNPKILIVDGESPACEMLKKSLKSKGFDCLMADRAEKALACLAEESFDVALMELELPDMNGMELLKRFNSDFPSVSSIIITSVNSVDTAVEIMKAGALDYMTKPFDIKRVEKSIQCVLNKRVHSKGSYNDSQKELEDMDSIAQGVEARQEILDVHFEKVVYQTVEIARNMGFSEEGIQKWVALQERETANRVKIVTDSILKIC